MHSGRWAEAARLFRPNLAPNWKDVAVATSPCRRSRRWKASHSSRFCSDHHGVSFPAQARGRGLPQNSET
eukprot:6824103-Prymnesium_polylepis.1